MGQSDYLPGMLRVLLLGELAQGSGYGYGLARAIELHSGGKLTVQPESLYPVLHRMEQQELVQAEWQQGENGRPRKMYVITPKGRKQWDRARKRFTIASEGALNVIAGLSGEGAR